MGYALEYLAQEISKMKEQKLFRYPRVLSGRQMARCTFDGKELVKSVHVPDRLVSFVVKG